MTQNVGGSKLLPQQAMEQIEKYIADNHLTAGDKLPNEFQLAEICGVGRSTVREAVKLLVFAGKVEVIRGCGTYIKDTSQEPEQEETDHDPMGFFFGSADNINQRAMEYVEVRMMLEPEVAAMAASNATYKDCKRLKELQLEVERCMDENPNQEHLDADIQFHLQIAACTHNHIISNLMEIVVKGIPVFIEVTGNKLVDITKVHHRQITNAITAGDSTGAKYAMIQHLIGHRNNVLKRISEEKDQKEQKKS